MSDFKNIYLDYTNIGKYLTMKEHYKKYFKDAIKFLKEYFTISINNKVEIMFIDNYEENINNFLDSKYKDKDINPNVNGRYIPIDWQSDEYKWKNSEIILINLETLNCKVEDEHIKAYNDKVYSYLILYCQYEL